MSFFDFVVVAMYATQSSRFGVPCHAIVSPLSRNRFRPSTFARGFRLACMIAVLHQEVRVRGPKTSEGDRGVSREASRKFSELLWITANLPFDQSVGERDGRIGALTQEFPRLSSNLPRVLVNLPRLSQVVLHQSQ